MKHKACNPTNGNCVEPGDDGLPVQCVGGWAIDKHDYLRRYIEATSGPRAHYVTTRKTSAPGGAAYIDLFAGPGQARVRDTGDIIAGSPLVALAHRTSPFSRVVLCEKDPDNVAALRRRTEDQGNVTIVEGDCNEQIDRIVAQVPPRGLNIALVDPYGLKPLLFSTLSKLAVLPRMDMIIHFPTMDMKRNLKLLPEYRARIARFLGVEESTLQLTGPADIPLLIDVLRRQLGQFGYTQAQVHSVAMKNSSQSVLYHLVYVSKHQKGNEIWSSIVKTTAGGQTGFSF